MSAQSIIKNLGGQWLGSYGIAPCPLCQPERRRDQRALSIIDKGDHVVVTCFKGCDNRNIMAFLGLNNIAPLFKVPRGDAAQRRLEREDRQRNAALKTETMLQNSTLETHPYFVRKGFPNMLVPVYGGAAILPIKDSAGNITSAQRIYPDGEKLFVKGGRIKGCAYKTGLSGPIILCEGVATGMSIWRSVRNAGDKAVVVLSCMNTEGLVNVAKQGIGELVCADHDEPRYPAGEPIYGAGEWAARKTGLPYVMPPNLGDFNDMETSAGSEAVWAIIKTKLLK